MPQAVLIIGASGGTGVELVRQALRRGHCVTAFVRAAWRSPASHSRLRVVVGDVMEPSSLDDAMAAQSAVLCALGHHRYYSSARVLSIGTRNIVEAMHRQHVQRLICETSLGVGDSSRDLGLLYTLFVKPLLAPRYFRDKARQEAVIRNSGTDWTIVRPGALTNGPATGTYRTGARVGHAIRTVRISRADVAAFMLRILSSGEHVHETVGIAY